MRALPKAKMGRASPTGSTYFLSTYRRSHFRLSASIQREMKYPAVVRVVIGNHYAYIGPVRKEEEPTDTDMRVTSDGKFSSKALKDWLGDPAAGTHYEARMIAPGVARIDRRQTPK